MLPCLLRVSIIYKKFLQIPADIFIRYKCQSGCELKKKHVAKTLVCITKHILQLVAILYVDNFCLWNRIPVTCKWFFFFSLNLSLERATLLLRHTHARARTRTHTANFSGWKFILSHKILTADISNDMMTNYNPTNYLNKCVHIVQQWRITVCLIPHCSHAGLSTYWSNCCPVLWCLQPGASHPLTSASPYITHLTLDCRVWSVLLNPATFCKKKALVDINAVLTSQHGLKNPLAVNLTSCFLFYFMKTLLLLPSRALLVSPLPISSS